MPTGTNVHIFQVPTSVLGHSWAFRTSDFECPDLPLGTNGHWKIDQVIYPLMPKDIEGHLL